MKILVTAGPTREHLDPVRFLSNRSSGKMGYAVARAAARRGHGVLLVSGPVSLKAPRGVRTVRVTSAAEMRCAVMRHLPECRALVMTAAVADWRPKVRAARKTEKGSHPPRIMLVRNVDILADAGRRKGRRIHVGFAAETHDPVRHALRKLRRKNLDLIVVNDVSAKDSGFDVDTNRVILITSGEDIRRLPLMSKARVASRIIRWVEAKAAG